MAGQEHDRGIQAGSPSGPSTGVGQLALASLDYSASSLRIHLLLLYHDLSPKGQTFSALPRVIPAPLPRALFPGRVPQARAAGRQFTGAAHLTLEHLVCTSLWRLHLAPRYLSPTWASFLTGWSLSWGVSAQRSPGRVPSARPEGAAMPRERGKCAARARPLGALVGPRGRTAGRDGRRSAVEEPPRRRGAWPGVRPDAAGHPEGALYLPYGDPFGGGARGCVRRPSAPHERPFGTALRPLRGLGRPIWRSAPVRRLGGPAGGGARKTPGGALYAEGRLGYTPLGSVTRTALTRPRASMGGFLAGSEGETVSISAHCAHCAAVHSRTPLASWYESSSLRHVRPASRHPPAAGAAARAAASTTTSHGADSSSDRSDAGGSVGRGGGGGLLS
eukprot:scaffold604_cov384-Prasinococcus_capsulatus_cf.AAC.14